MGVKVKVVRSRMASTVSEILSECLLLLLSSATLSLPLTSIVCARLLLYGSQAHDNSSLNRQNVSMQKARSRMVSHLHSTRLLIGGKVLPKSRSNRRRRFTAEMPIAIAVGRFTTPDKNPTWIFFSARLRTGICWCGEVGLASQPGGSTHAGGHFSLSATLTLPVLLCLTLNHRPCTHLR